MSEEKPERRTVRTTLNRKFGVSENTNLKRYRREEPEEGQDRGERRPFGERKFGHDSERKPFGERKFDRDSERRPFGERKRFDRDSERRLFGERKHFDRDSERRPFGERKSFDRDGERRPFGERKRFDRDSERRPFGERKRFDRDFDRKPFGERSKFDNRPVFRKRPTEEPEESQNADDSKAEELLEKTFVAAEASSEEEVPQWFKKVLALTTEKGREREGNFLGEGVHVVQELVSKHSDQVIGVYYAPSFQNESFLDAIRAAGVRLHDITEELMQKASTTVTSQGIFAVCRAASVRPDYEASRSVITIVDAVQDPGNLGTLFRTSLGFSSNGMILGKGTVSPFNPKVVRGSSGTFLRVPFESGVELVDKINFLRQKGYVIIATDLHARQTLRDLSPRKLRKVAFLVGNEGAGTNSYLIEVADETVRIPMSSELESLNVAVAHGILSYEIAQIQKELLG